MPSFSIENARVFDGDRLSEPRTLFVVDGLIADAAGPDSKTVDAAGAALLPGLIDGHVHVDDPGQAAVLAQWGVTTALDMGAKDPAVIAGLRGATGIAQILTAGFPAGPSTGTHIARLGYPAGIGISRPEEAGAWVAARVAEGSDYIKIVIGSPGADHDQATVDALVAAAHEHGKQAVAHASSYAAVAKAQQAGVDVLTHAPLDQALDETSVTRMATGGRILIPTLTMMQTLVSRLGLPDASYAAARASVAAAYRAGVPVLAGTDANADAGSPAAVSHGDSLHHELELLVDAGLTSLDALRAATVLPARYFGLADRGVVEPGCRADLVLLDGDPLRDIRATRSLRLIWCGGIERRPAELSG